MDSYVRLTKAIKGTGHTLAHSAFHPAINFSKPSGFLRKYAIAYLGGSNDER